uniref:Degenerin n=1 Tax=Caenorhabditis japonica TaxID=281687 RepID=A0A8R1HYA8_CAEJA
MERQQSPYIRPSPYLGGVQAHFEDDDDRSRVCKCLETCFQHVIVQLHASAIYSERRTSSRKSLRSQKIDYHATTIKSLWFDFCARTSSHGIPYVATSSFFGRYVWAALFMCMLMAFLLQTYWTMSEYLQYRTIIEMQLQFEAAAFPAATVCNLNAFKYSELIQYDEIKEGFDYWERVINARMMSDSMKPGEKLEAINVRKKRTRYRGELVFPIDEEDMEGAEYQPVFVKCTCMNMEQCVPNRNPLEVNASICMCFEDVTRGLIWPCYPTTVWTVKKCTGCSISNTCPDPDGPYASKQVAKTNNNPLPCLCQSISHHCMVHPKDEIKWWNPNNYTVYSVTDPPTTEITETEEAFGLSDLKDAGAITTQTKENLIFLVAALPRETRRNLSYTLNEFVLRCSFNSKDCNMDRDFKLHVDPEYGNCYTFNFNDSVELKNSRAGPMYGQCLSNLTSDSGGYHHLHEQCECRQPCHEKVFETAYSASAWPSINFKIGTDCPAVADIFNDTEACTEYYRQNTAYIEIYYEQLNFESLKETAGYTASFIKRIGVAVQVSF